MRIELAGGGRVACGRGARGTSPHRHVWAIVPAVLTAFLGLSGCGPGGGAQATGDAELLKSARGLFQPLPRDFALAGQPATPQQVALGRLLFFDPRISADGTVSCSRCHEPALYGTDALPLPIGNRGRVNPRNAPTVLNAALQLSEHWRGDRVSVEDQATRALVGPPSFGLQSYAEAAARLHATGYDSLFRAAFPGDSAPVTAENWGKAIGAYERTLVTPAPFDAFLEGNTGAIGTRAKAGLRGFIAAGCGACHNGAGVGGASYQKFGVVKDYWTATGSSTIDRGRFDVTHNPADMYVFKVPSLRNVAMTPPYFHDGSVSTLPAAVRVMGQVQLGRDLSARDVDEIVAFLQSLTGPLPPQFDRQPLLPTGAYDSLLPTPPAQPGVAAAGH